MKRNKKILLIRLFFIFLIISVFFVNISFARKDKNAVSLTGSMTNANNVTTGGETGYANIINFAITAIQLAGTGISVIMVTLLGLKYVMASAQDKAEIKKQAVPIVIGSAILFSAVNITKIIADFGANVKG